MLVGLAVLGAGGWFGWSALSGGSGSGESEEPEVVIPEIPAELEPRMRELAAVAYESMLDSLRSRALLHEIPVEPNSDWLGGEYLANASQYPGIMEYWQAFDAYLGDVRQAEEAIFVSEYRAALDSAEVRPDDRDTLLVRARAGFQASRRDRRLVYDQLEALIDAAIGLHEFLLANEADIDYEPATGGLSRDPVTEAVPATEALGTELWDRVEAIPSALDALGALDRVNTERVLDVFFRRLEATSIR